jgi:hypothetical protein
LPFAAKSLQVIHWSENPAGKPVALVPEFGAQTVMLIEPSVVLAQKICGVSMLSALSGVMTKPRGLPILALVPKISPAPDRQATRIITLFTVIVRLMI